MIQRTSCLLDDDGFGVYRDEIAWHHRGLRRLGLEFMRNLLFDLFASLVALGAVCLSRVFLPQPDAPWLAPDAPWLAPMCGARAYAALAATGLALGAIFTFTVFADAPRYRIYGTGTAFAIRVGTAVLVACGAMAAAQAYRRHARQPLDSDSQATLTQNPPHSDSNLSKSSRFDVGDRNATCSHARSRL